MHWGHETLLDYEAYHSNLIKFYHLVPPEIRRSPVYHFLAFILNPRHAGRSILSHYGAKYDTCHVLAILAYLGVPFTVLPQGNGVLLLKITTFSIVLLDSYKFIMNPLHELSHRFNLDDGDVKGYFPFLYTKVERFGLVQKDPPDLSFYINPHKDDAKVRAKKKTWHEAKSNMDYISLNDDAVMYCRMDVRVLNLAVLLFLAQSFSFQDLLVKRYGPSPCARKGTLPFFHMFTK